MKLQRRSIKDSEVKGKWYFVISGKDSEAEKIESLETALRAEYTGYSVGGREIPWDDYCDGCPLYEDGMSSGFWIAIGDVEAFKASWKKVKAN